jgi:hypothetical protein
MALKPFSSQRLSTRRFNPLNATPTPLNEPYFPYTTLLLLGNGTNGAQNNTFLDSSTNNFTITRNGNTTQGTFSPFSQTGWGNYFSGSSQYLSVADSTAFTMGTGDFTVEYWIYWPGSGNNFRVYGQVDSGGSSASISIRGGTDASNKVINGAFSGTTDYLCTSTASLVANTWNHIAFVRDGTTLRQYINGGQDGTASISTASVNDSSNQFAIGRAGEFNGNYFGGYISNFRLVKGRCVYPSGTSFTPPTSPLTRTTGGTNPPQGTETSLLTCQSNRFLDSNGVNIPASSPLTITVNGSPSVQAFSPFNPTASWSAATYGGSGYFDGNGDYLTLGGQSAFVFGTGDFTIEMFAYVTNTANTIFDLRPSTPSGAYITIYVTGGVIYYYANGANQINGGTLPLNQWVHIVASRVSSNTRLFINGVQAGLTYSDTTNYTTSGSRPIIGADGNVTGSSPMIGYLSNLRVVKGSGVTSVTVPTAPLTAITNTSLLLNFTNAGIYDATSKNDLETVGNTQISTTQSKFGGSSMSFDGTGDYLYSISKPTTSLEGDFTIELWLYRNVSGNTPIFTLGDSFTANGFEIYIGSSGTQLIVFSGNASRITSATLPSVTTWAYLAATRSGSTVTLYLNGTSLGTWSSSSTFSGAVYVGTEFYNGSVSGSLNGYIQDLRITKGYARTVTASPTAAFPTL